MLVLGIESSCDETAASIVRDGHEVLSSVISSQIKLHAGYGGVIPELAAREHLKNILTVVRTSLTEADISLDDIGGMAVTSYPGLIPALLVGNTFSKGLAASRHYPLIGINHFEAHMYGAFIDHPELLTPEHFPIIALVVSGGHTAIVCLEANGQARILGRTLDDAAGEALDKAAKILGLEYPGGPIIDRLAKNGNTKAYHFPRGLMGGSGRPIAPEHRFDFSFSGVKTAMLYAVKNRELTDSELSDVVASYQAAIMQVLVKKTIRAAREVHAKLICLSGGVACNSYLRHIMAEAAEKIHCDFVLTPPKYCTDNAAMVSGLGWHFLRRGMDGGLTQPVSARLPADLGIFPFAPFAPEDF